MRLMLKVARRERRALYPVAHMSERYEGLGFAALVDLIVGRTGWERDWVEDVATPRYPCAHCRGTGQVPAITEDKKRSGALAVLKVLDRETTSQ